MSVSSIPSSVRAEKALERAQAKLTPELLKKGLQLGQPIFIRIFKESSELEVWMQQDKQFVLFKRYAICTFSGDLGPKTKEGDRQAPEGFYYVKASQLNPSSRFHLSFNLGYPNAYDRSHGYTGSALMVHGSCVSIGCYAMGDAAIEEIYTLAHSAFANGQAFFRVHIFPFHLTDEKLSRYSNHQWFGYWKNLQEGYLHFNQAGIPPNVTVKNGRYFFEDQEISNH